MQTIERPILRPLQTTSGILKSMMLFRWLHLLIPGKTFFLSSYLMVETILMMWGATLVDTTCSDATTASAKLMGLHYHVINYTPTLRPLA
jgi:hypothetical protein